jgi:tetratricopeptide (TPR) repeat protein
VRIFIIILFLLFPIQAKAYNGIPESPTLKKVMELVKAKKTSEALQILSTYRSSPEELSLYHYAYAKATEMSGKQQESLSHYRLAYIYAPDSEMKELTLLERAEAYLMIGLYPEATACFRLFLKQYPNSQYFERVHLGLADSLYHQGRFTESILHYEKSGNSSHALFGKANAYQSMGQIKNAYTLYMSTIEQDREFLKSSQETLYNIAENLRLMGKSNDAKIYYNSIEDPFFKKKSNIGLGLIAIGEANYNAAFKYFRSALDTPNRQLKREALLLLADAYLKEGKKEDARPLLIEIRNKYPYGKEYDTALLMLSRLYRNEGKINESVLLLKELASRRAPSKDAIDEFETLILEAKNKNSDELLKLWRVFKHFLLDPSRAEALVEIAKGLRSSGRPFIDLCKWLLENGPNNAKAECSLSLANFYVDIGDAAIASTYLLRIKGNTDDILRIRAKIYKEKKEDNKAIQEILSIKEVRPNDIVLFSDLLEHAKDKDKAVAFCEKSLIQVGAPLKVYIKLADTLYEMGRESDALKFYSIVASLKPENRKDLTQDDAGWTYYMVSKLSQGKNSASLLSGIQAGNNLFSRSAETAVKESDILERMKRVF